MVEKEHIIHIRLENEEAVESRKGMLSTQIGLLKVLTRINEYDRHRIREGELKTDVIKKMKDLRSKFNDLEKILPKLKVPKIIKDQEKEKEATTKKEKILAHDSSVEMQLHDIQRKLDELQRKGY